jgi:zinc transport system permease protein
MADFILYALIAGLSLSVVAGPLGSFVVWRRMSYFGDTLAHSSLLGIALGILLGVNLQLSIVVICLGSAALLIFLDQRKNVAIDTLLGILAHSTLAIGVVLLAVSNTAPINLEAYLFGELLTIATTDLVWVVVTSLLVLAVIFVFWNQLLSITVHEELADIEGVDVKKLRYLLVVLMALITAVAMKIVGVLLITSLLIIPPAAARQVSKSPEQMAVIASVLGSLSVVLGLYLAFRADTPVGPTIVVVATATFFAFYFFPKPKQSNQ